MVELVATLRHKKLSKHVKAVIYKLICIYIHVDMKHGVMPLCTIVLIDVAGLGGLATQMP